MAVRIEQIGAPPVAEMETDFSAFVIHLQRGTTGGRIDGIEADRELRGMPEPGQIQNHVFLRFGNLFLLIIKAGLDRGNLYMPLVK